MEDAAGPATGYAAAKAKQQALRGGQSDEVDEVEVSEVEKRRRKLSRRRLKTHTSPKTKHVLCR